MKNIYENQLEKILHNYDMRCSDVIDSTYVNSLIVKMFQENCTNKRIALWGAGRNNTLTSHASVILGRYISQLQGMVCLIDSAKEVQGGELFGFPIISPEDAIDKELDLIIVASRASAESIRNSIAGILPGCEVLDIYQELRNQGINLYYNFYEEKSQYSQLYDLRKKYEDSTSESEKKDVLRDLIATYLAIRDFVCAFRFIDSYVGHGYDKDGSMVAMRHEIEQLVQEVKEKNQSREGDITIYFIDSVRAMDAIEESQGEVTYHFIKPYLEKSFVFTNAYSTGPTTYESLIGLLAQQYSFSKDVYADNFMFSIEEVPFLQKACDKGMALHFYVSEEYKIMKPDKRILFDNHIHMTEKLWNMACDKAASKKPVLSFAYIVWELHFPLLCGYLTNEPVINGFYEVGLKDMSGYIEQQFEDCFSYTDEEFLYYEGILHDGGYSVFFSDHSQVVYDKGHIWPFYKYYNDPEKQTHCMLALQGPSIQPGIYGKYVSMVNFNKILCSFLFGEETGWGEDSIVRYQYYNIHNPELRRLAEEKGYLEYIDGMDCFASKDFVYMVNIYGKQEVYRRSNLGDDIAGTEEGKRFIDEVSGRFKVGFPSFLLERLKGGSL